MEDLDVLARDFGLAARGKANPMRSAAAERRGAGDPLFSEVFGGQAKYTPTSNSYGNHKQSAGSDLDYASIFQSTSGTGVKKSNVNEKSSPVPVYDKPMYDDDIFDGLPGVKSKSGGSTVRFDDDVFASISSTGRSQNQSSNFDGLLGNFGRGEKTGEKNKSSSAKSNINSEGFDDLLAGFGNGSPNARNRFVPESRWRSVPDAASNLGNTLDDPFVVLESNSAPNTSSGRFTDPLEEIGKLNKSRSARVEAPSGGGVFDDLDPLSTIGKSAYSNSRSKDNGGKDGHQMPATSKSAATKEPTGNSSFGHFKSNMKDEVPVDKFQEPPIFDVPNVSMDFQKSSGQPASSPQHYDTGPQADTSASGQGHEPDDAWLTVSEVPLFTQSSTAPPPSRPPPPIPHQASRPQTRSYSSSFRKKGGEFSPPSSPQSLNLSQPEVNGPLVSQFDDLEGFAMGRSRNSFNGTSNLHSNMETTSFSEAAASAAAMKDAMDKAEAKFRHAKEAREREQAKAARNKEFGQVEKDEHEAHERKFRESQVRLEQERKHKEEEEREQRRLEKERLREMESQKARQAVERAAREARERAAVEARERASAEVRLRAERAAVEKANAEARLRAERAALQRARAEARERAAAEAKERAEKAAAAEAREKDAAASRIEAEAKRRAERAAVERAAAEARERAAAQARERAASAARKNQQTNDNDLESFFSMGRASSAPRASSNTTDPFFNQQFNSKSGSDGVKQAPPSSGAPSTMKKASSTSSFVDDLSSIFGAAPSGEFQEIEGEPEERRKARLERHQRTQERAAKALAEKNQRDLQTQREQQERHRVADTLDIEIKRWAAGKEGNLRALLSTLQYVLWPECGWQPVSLTDLITAASVKKVYRKATLCVHPDKVQQKGANLQQKYIAEKVFDLLKEAWNKFNSEELF